MREDRAKNPQIPSRNRDAVDDGALVALDQLGLAEAVEPHPEPRPAGLLLLLAGRGGRVIDGRRMGSLR